MACRRKTEARINSFDNFKATVATEDGTDMEMHFIALTSDKANAIPVVLLHGWPGSPLEFLSLLDLARSKYSAADLPYTFIVPSLPGFAFSSGPSQEKTSDCESIAYAVDQLMVGLGYGNGYVAQGGDIGSFVARILAARHDACRAAHSESVKISPVTQVRHADVRACGKLILL